MLTELGDVSWVFRGSQRLCSVLGKESALMAGSLAYKFSAGILNHNFEPHTFTSISFIITIFITSNEYAIRNLQLEAKYS